MSSGKQFFNQPTILTEVKPGDLKTGPEHILQTNSSLAPTTTTMITSRQPQMVIVQQQSQQGQPGQQLPMQILYDLLLPVAIPKNKKEIIYSLHLQNNKQS
jgi:hypothetical protein